MIAALFLAATVAIPPGAPKPEAARITAATAPGVDGKGTLSVTMMRAFSIDAAALLARKRHPSPAGVHAYELSPSVAVRFTGAHDFTIGCKVAATLDGTAWHARYLVWMFEAYDRRSKADIAAAARSLKPCFAEAGRLFDVHASGGMLPGKTPRMVEMDGRRQPRFMVDAERERAILPDGEGLVEYHPPLPLPLPKIVVPPPVTVPDMPVEAPKET